MMMLSTRPSFLRIAAAVSLLALAACGKGPGQPAPDGEAVELAKACLKYYEFEALLQHIKAERAGGSAPTGAGIATAFAPAPQCSHVRRPPSNRVRELLNRLRGPEGTVSESRAAAVEQEAILLARQTARLAARVR